MDPPTQRYASYAITALVMLVVLGLRFRSMAKARPLKLGRLWIFPAVYGCIATYIFVAFPPESRGWAYASIGLFVGVILGWKRGEMMQIMVDPETKSLTQKASPAAMIFIVVLILARMGSRMFIAEGAVNVGFHGTTQLVTDTLIAMALGFLTAQRLEMYLRAKRLVARG